MKTHLKEPHRWPSQEDEGESGRRTWEQNTSKRLQAKGPQGCREAKTSLASVRHRERDGEGER